MLYRTHHPFFFQFPSATTAAFSPVRLLSSSSKVQTEMECVEVALTTSFRKEMAQKSSPQVYFDDAWAVNVPNGVSCDDFVDELLDFSNEDGFVGGGGEEEEEEEKACAVSVSPEQETAVIDKNGDRTTNFSAKDDFGSVPASELGVPADDLASLEWLSHFVEDSNSEYSAPFPASIPPEVSKKENRPEPQKQVLTEPCFKTPVPAKARSKRTRTGVRVWPLGSPSLTESSSSSTSSSSSSGPPNHWLIYTKTEMNIEPSEPVCFEQPPSKKQKKKQSVEAANGGGTVGGAQLPRRCSHCGVQKTPQWRTGPLGAKTLCNACGVRYKSGRLLPEYRPACSPTFSSELHSNHHRKVLEMRKKKEMVVQSEPGFAPPVVPSFG